MLLAQSVGLFLNPTRQWEKVRDKEVTVTGVVFGHTAILGLISPICAYFGTTKVGWTIGYSEVVRLTSASALSISIIYYITIVVGVIMLGALIRWMSKTYGSDESLAKCVSLASLPATPIFLVGFVQLYPVLWINYLVGLPALAYSIYLLYSGTRIVMKLSREHAFLMASAILAACLVALVAVLASTVTLWEFGFEPGFVL